MKYKTITIQKVINLGNYESQRLEVSAEIDTEDEDAVHDALLELNATVTDALAQFKQQHDYVKQLEEEEKKKLSQPPW